MSVRAVQRGGREQLGGPGRNEERAGGSGSVPSGSGRVLLQEVCWQVCLRVRKWQRVGAFGEGHKREACRAAARRSCGWREPLGWCGNPSSECHRENASRQALRSILVLSLLAVFVVACGGGARQAEKKTPARVAVVTTLAGKADSRGSANGSGATARFDFPAGIVCDRHGNLYVTDLGNNIIRKVTPAGLVSTVAGGLGPSMWADGVGSAARFSHPAGIALDSAATSMSLMRRTTHFARSHRPGWSPPSLQGWFFRKY